METNHFALKTKLYVNVLHSVFQTLREFNLFNSLHKMS